MTSAASSQPTTSGTGTAPASPSQRSPRASASKPPGPRTLRAARIPARSRQPALAGDLGEDHAAVGPSSRAVVAHAVLAAESAAAAHSGAGSRSSRILGVEAGQARVRHGQHPVRPAGRSAASRADPPGPGRPAAAGRRPARTPPGRRYKGRGPPGRARQRRPGRVEGQEQHDPLRGLRVRGHAPQPRQVARVHGQPPGHSGRTRTARTAAPGARCRRSRAGKARPGPPGPSASPRCQSPVPALSTSTLPVRPARSSSARSTTSAMGDRQMLPRQTRQTRYVPDAMSRCRRGHRRVIVSGHGTSMPDAVNCGAACHDGGMPAANVYRKLSFWHDTVPGTLEPGEPLPGDLEADVAIAGAGYTGLWTAYYLSRADPGPEDRGLRARHRRVRRVGPQRRLVLGAVPRVAGQAGADGGPGRGDRACTGPCRRRWTRWAGWPRPRASTATGPRAGPCSSPARPASWSGPPRRSPRPGRSGSARRTCGCCRPAEASALAGASDVLGGTFTPHCAAIHPARLVRGLAEAVRRRGVSRVRAHAGAADRARAARDGGRDRAGPLRDPRDRGLHRAAARPAPGGGAGVLADDRDGPAARVASGTRSAWPAGRRSATCGT